MQEQKPVETTPLTKTEETLVNECAARVREKICKTVKTDAVNVAAFGLVVVALASSVHTAEWTTFCHVLQFVSIVGALALLFWNNFHQLVEFLNEKRGGRRRECLFCVAGGLLLLAGWGLILLGAYSPVNWLTQGCQIAGLVLMGIALLALVAAFLIGARTTWRIVRVYRRVRTTDDENELKALLDEVERIKKES